MSPMASPPFCGQANCTVYVWVRQAGREKRGAALVGGFQLFFGFPYSAILMSRRAALDTEVMAHWPIMLGALISLLVAVLLIVRTRSRAPMRRQSRAAATAARRWDESCLVLPREAPAPTVSIRLD